ncbi:MAG: hypothetical protein UH080_05960 [Ruminococcus sp.]|nr:hypothetical protein [Ruminococcus sp.]
MKNSKLKKALAVILSAAMMTSVMSVAGVSASAAESETTKNYYVPAEDTETITVYFYMPESWYNEYTDTAGAYWWEGTDACPSCEEMYAMTPTDTENIYSIEVPADVLILLFNNYVDGGENIYSIAKRTTEVLVNPFSEDMTPYPEDGNWVYYPETDEFPADSDLYKEGLASVDGMIYVIDKYICPSQCLTQNPDVMTGEWYYYYGNGEYGFTPEKSEPVYTSEYNEIEVAVDHKYNGYKPPEPSNDKNTIYFDAKSMGWSSNSEVYCDIFSFDGTGSWEDVDFRKKLCTKEADGRYSYNISVTGNTIDPDDGKKYGVVFSNDNGDKTYTLVMSGDCLGDTAYSTGKTFENPSDNIGYCKEMAWKNTPDCGSLMQLYDLDKTAGTTIPDCITNEKFIAQHILDDISAYHFRYFEERTKIAGLFSKFDADPTEVLNELKVIHKEALENNVIFEENANDLIAETELLVKTLLSDDNAKPDFNTAHKDAKIYVDAESFGWENCDTISCHIWRYDGTGEWLEWATKKEYCTKEADGRYSFSLSTTGNKFTYMDDAVYGVIFYTNTGSQTYEVIMDGNCIGDTVCYDNWYDEGYYEAPQDSTKVVMEAMWFDNFERGMRKRITASGEVIGNDFFEGENDETMMADYLIKFYQNDSKMSKLQKLFDKLIIDTVDVLYEVKLKEDFMADAGEKTQEQADAEYAEIEKILENIQVDIRFIHDIDGMDFTDVKDVTTLQMFLADYDVEVKESKLDVNADGIVDVKDVTALQLYLVS